MVLLQLKDHFLNTVEYDVTSFLPSFLLLNEYKHHIFAAFLEYFSSHCVCIIIIFHSFLHMILQFDYTILDCFDDLI